MIELEEWGRMSWKGIGIIIVGIMSDLLCNRISIKDIIQSKTQMILFYLRCHQCIHNTRKTKIDKGN